MLTISELSSGIKLIGDLLKVRNQLSVSSYHKGLDTIVVIHNRGYFCLKDIKATIEEPEKYYWNITDSPTIEIPELGSEDKQQFTLCSKILEESKANIRVSFRGVFSSLESSSFEVNVASMIDQY